MSKDMQKLLKQAQRMQSQMLQAQEDMKQKEIQGTAGGGMVTITMNGGGDIRRVTIKPEVVDPDDVEMLEDLVLAAFVNAQEKIKELSEQTFGGFSLPGMKL